MDRCVCIHGHFYQPPRENAWLEEIEVQDSAYPYHDWNERITAECYGPNTASRILGEDNRIVEIVNNYAKISFDAGPTLLAWMENRSPAVYRAILAADEDSRKRYHGHGSAMAQAYNHTILPLANLRDKRTQIIWGIVDFEARFRRKPEGLWLPEAAVDSESLDIMAELGIGFAVLAPYQAAKTRKIKGGEWADASAGKIDPKMPYRCNLPSGRSIVLFFYDGPIARDVAFGDVLQNGGSFARRLLAAFSETTNQSEIVHIATDGETYGHHHRFGDMALAFCLDYLEKNKLAELTVYADYLERFAPTHEVKIFENSSWSCGHGVERWRADCGDSTGSHPGWNQKWRAPLREAMDWLRDSIIPMYEKEAVRYAKDPWSVRDDYVRVINDRSPVNIEAFFARNAARPLSPDEKVRVLKLCEIQRHAMLMYASDGWFFDDISNVETVQILQYAARAMQLVRDVDGRDLEPEYVRKLAKASSNVPGFGDGAKIYETLVKPATVTFLRLGAHYAVSSLFEEYPKDIKIAHYGASSDVCEQVQSGKRKLAVGKVELKSEITWEERTVGYAVLHFGDQNLTAGVRNFDPDLPYREICGELKDAFARGDFPAVIRLIDQNFGMQSYSIWHLFRDEKRKVLDRILDSTLRGLAAVYRQIYESNYSLMQALVGMQIPLPEALAAPAEFILDTDFRNLMEREGLDLGELRRLVGEFLLWSFKPENPILSLLVSRKLDGLMENFSRHPDDPGLLKSIQSAFEILRPLSLDLDLWKSQNIYFSVVKERYAGTLEKAGAGDAAMKDWVDLFAALGEFLKIKLPVSKTK